MIDDLTRKEKGFSDDFEPQIILLNNGVKIFESNFIDKNLRLILENYCKSKYLVLEYYSSIYCGYENIREFLNKKVDS